MKIYFSNDLIDQEKEIFVIANCEDSDQYEIWKIRFDKRFKLGSRTEYIKTIQLKAADIDNQIGLDLSDHPKLSKIDPIKNSVLLITKNKSEDLESSVLALSSSISFTRGVKLGLPFNLETMEELYDILIDERVLPFTIKTWF